MYFVRIVVIAEIQLVAVIAKVAVIAVIAKVAVIVLVASIVRVVTIVNNVVIAGIAEINHLQKILYKKKMNKNDKTYISERRKAMKTVEKYVKEISRVIAGGDEQFTCLAFAHSRDAGSCKKCPLKNVKCADEDEVLKWLIEEAEE